jgi:hypothetical protein
MPKQFYTLSKPVNKKKKPSKHYSNAPKTVKPRADTQFGTQIKWAK